jgi:cytochrome b involved in lipid metabolism
MQKYYASLLLIPLFTFGAGCNESITDEPTNHVPDTTMDEGSAINVTADDKVTEEATMEITTSYTIEDVAAHNIKEDCWFVIDGKVYDVTDYDNHPDGDSAFDGCGLDATEMFNNVSKHGDKARGFLPNFEIGALK